MRKTKTRGLGPTGQRACRCELTRASLRPGGAGVTVLPISRRGSQAQKATRTPPVWSLSAALALSSRKDTGVPRPGPPPPAPELYFPSPQARTEWQGWELVCTVPWSRVSDGQGH